MSTSVPLADNSADIVNMVMNNIPGQTALNANSTGVTPGSQQNDGALGQQQQPALTEQQLQQLQQFQQLQLMQQQLVAQSQAPGVSQLQLQNIAQVRQAIHNQQMAILAQHQQQQNQQSVQLAQGVSGLQSVAAPATNATSTQAHSTSKAAVTAAAVPTTSAAATTPATPTTPAQSATNGVARTQVPRTGTPTGMDSNQIAALEAIAARIGIPANIRATLPPAQLQALIQNYHAQQQLQQQYQLQQQQQQLQMRLRQASETPSAAGGQTPISANAKSTEMTRSASVRSSKSVARDRSKSQSPGPQQLLGMPRPFSPTASFLSQASPPPPPPFGGVSSGIQSPRSLSSGGVMQRKGSVASAFADDPRATPTPSEVSIRGGTPHTAYSPEEVAKAIKSSEEFVKKLPEFNSETFMEFLLKFYKENDITGNFSKKPVFDEKHIDLYRFFCEVIRSGGLEQVHTKRIWRQVAKDSGLPDIPTLPPLLSRWYKSWLQPLEQLRVFPPGHPKHTGIHANFSLKKRKKDSLNSPGGTPGPGSIERPFSVSADSQKRMKMYSPLTNGAVSANASPAHHTPPPPPPQMMSSMGMSMGIPPQMNVAASLSSLPTLPTNGLASTPTRPASQVAVSGTSSVQSPVAPKPAAVSIANNATAAGPVPNGPAPPLAAGQQQSVVQPQPQTQPQPQPQPHQPAPVQSKVQVLTVPPPPPGPKPLNWFPLERTVDTCGGVDLQSALMCRPQLRLPNLGDYGSIDIRALTLSIESGIAMEVTNALNTLVQATAHPDTVLPLKQCDELAEALFDILQGIKLPSETKQSSAGSEVQQQQTKTTVNGTYSTDTRLFNDSYEGAVDEGGMVGDDIQDETSLRGLLLGGDDLWSFTSNRALTVIYALRNLSFLHVNQQYYADSAEFASMFVSLVQKCRRAVDGVRQQFSDSDGSERLTSLVVWRAVEFRKSLLLILSNIAHMVNLKAKGEEFLQATMELLAYFADEQQTTDVIEGWLRDCAPVVMGDPLAGIAHVKALDGHMYYLLALESAARLTTIDVNRLVLAGKVDSDHYMALAMACAGILSGHQTSLVAYPGSVQNFGEKRLMWLQYALVVLSNLVTIATPQPLVASRKYTRFWITENGKTNPSLGSNASTNGVHQQQQQQQQQQQRATTKRPMPFVPMTYAAMAVPAEMKRFRHELAANTNLVRALLEIVLVWWARIGLQCSRGPTPQVPDSPFNELAERAMHILQMLHPEHDALFAARWREWVVGRTTNTYISPMLSEVLYELVGLIPVQSAGQLQGGGQAGIC